ncbi:hypothetical protein ALC62_09843, partial [Cyphomyrmex costatus]
IRHIENSKNEVPLTSKIAKWAVQENITLSALRNLLSIIREIPGCNDVPKDPRTLLRTPSNIITTPIGCGTYYYFGIEKTLNLFCINHNINIQSNEEFLIAVNIDGLPLSKSSNSSFWPILCSVKSIKILIKHVFLIALYHGSEKPTNEFFKDFVNECVYLSTNGILINSFRYTFRIFMLICDTPAKSFALSIKNHTGYFSCTKSTLTDNSFRTMAQSEHHIDRSMLLDIPNFNMIDNVPIDYMHNLLLGGMKRLLCHKRYGWIYGKPPHKLRFRDINKISENLLRLKPYIPCEFSRKTRSIFECKRYKATEFRLFLLYAGPIILKEVLPSKIYNHFITLSLASSIMVSQYYSKSENYVLYAHNLMKHFVCQSIKIYGPDFVSHNIHNFLHLSECVTLYGSLDNFSAFPFENYMQYLKKKVRKSAQPLQQVIRRVIEEDNNTECMNIINNDSIKLRTEHFNGPLTNNCTSPQYMQAQTNYYCLNISKMSDRFVELKNKLIIEVKNIASYENSVYLIGYRYSKRDSFYLKPCLSSLFDIQYIEKENDLLETWNIDFIKRKLVVLPYKHKFVSFPLLHM